MASFVYNLIKILLMTVAIVNKASAAASLTITGLTKNGKVSEKATPVRLTCNDAGGTLSGSPGYEWLKDGNSVAGSTKTLDVTPDAAGTTVKYTCKAQFDTVTGKTTSAEFTMEFVAVSLTVEVPNKKVSEKATKATLTCTEVADLAPSAPSAYVWKKDGNPVTGNANTLAITPGAAGTTATYTCENQFPKVTGKTTSAVLTLSFVAVSLTVEVPNKKVSVKATKATLTCTEVADLAPVNPSAYVWKKDGNSVTGNANTLAITPGAAGTTATYTCENQFPKVTGKTTSAELTLSFVGVSLTVEVKSKKVTATGGKVTLTCTEVADLDPNDPAAYEWKKDGKKVTGNTNTLDITPGAAGTTAIYTCENQFPKVTGKTKSADLTLSFVAAKVLEVTGDNGAKKDGDDVTLTCTETTSGATPNDGADAYVWYKDGTEVPSKTKDTLTVTPDTIVVSKYKCKATFDTKEITSNELTFTVSDDVYYCKKFKKEGKSWKEDGNRRVTCGFTDKAKKDKCQGPGSDFDANGKFNEATTICTECKDANNKQCSNKKLITYECPKYTWNKETTSFKKENDAKDTCYTTDEKKKDTCSKPGKKAEEGNIHAKAPGVCIPCTEDEKKEQKCGAMGLSAFIAPLVIVLYMMVM